MRRWGAALAGVVVAFAIPAGDAVAATIDGPHAVRPGHRVTFRLAYLEKRARLHVDLQPWSCRDSNGCGIAVDRHRHWRVGRHGRIRIRFRWPRHYLVCDGASNCHRRSWRRHRAAQITFCTGRVDFSCLRYRVRLRH